MIHKSVLLMESIDGLDIHAGDVFVDGTLGGGGHSEEVGRRFGGTVVMIGIDLDPEALARTKERLARLNLDMKLDIKYAEGSFRNIDSVLSELGVKSADKILLDIGLSSNQFEDSGRGFSFQKDEPLVMSFKKPARPPESTLEGAGGDLTESDLTARKIVNNWDEENIRTILESYGEEQFAWKIAKAIVVRREEKSIETTFELVDIVKSATPKFYHHRKIHPATKTFQALRITVNDEIQSLKEGIEKSFAVLNPLGRLAVISFHSLEDRVVKHFFKTLDTNGAGKVLTKKPIVPTDEEISENPRSRSAKLRIIEKV